MTARTRLLGLLVAFTSAGVIGVAVGGSVRPPGDRGRAEAVDPARVGSSGSRPLGSGPQRPADLLRSPAQCAAAVLAAVHAEDPDTLRALASRENPDPWLVADELFARGEIDAAVAFAGAAPRAAVLRLPKYLDRRRGEDDDAPLRSSVAAGDSALEDGRYADALAAVEVSEPSGDSVLRVRLFVSRGRALRGVGRREASARALETAAAAAERMGWTARAREVRDEIRLDALVRGDRSADLPAADRSPSTPPGAPSDAVATGLEAAQKSFDERLAAGDRAGAAASLGRMGAVHAALGNPKKALELQERALKEQETVGDRSGAAVTLRNIGAMHCSLGHCELAIESQERAWKVQDAAGDRVGAAATLGDIATVHRSLGQYETALAVYEKALAAQRAAGDRAGTAWTLQNIGSVYVSLGWYAKALVVEEKARAEQEAMGDHAGVAATLGILGDVHAALGNAPQALEALKRALHMQETLGDRPGAAITLGRIGSVEMILGDFEKALEVEERALQLQEALGDRAAAAVTLGHIGGVRMARQEFAAALATHERATEAHRRVGNREGAAMEVGNAGLAHRALGNLPEAIRRLRAAIEEAEGMRAARVLLKHLPELARTHLLAGDTGEALAVARRAVPLVESSLGRLGGEAGAAARGQFGPLFDVGVIAAARTGDAAEASFFLESGRARSLLESLGARDVMRSVPLPPDLKRAEEQARTGEVAADAALARALDTDDRDEIRTARESVDAARDRMRAVIDRIEREAKGEASVLYPRAATLDDLRSSLGAGEALVIYGFALDEVVALVVTAEAARILSLGPAAPFDEVCAALQLEKVEAETGAALEALRRLAVVPLRLAPAISRVLVSPDGPLSYVPFGALFPDRVVTHVPSGTTHLLLQGERALTGTHVLALGDPEVGAVVEETGGELNRSDPDPAGLPGSRAEVEAIGDVKLLGADASEPELRRSLLLRDRWHAVHFATHARINAERPTLSSLSLTPDGADDGSLTALDVFRMKIPADLVVLSSCETAKGRIFKGEGIVGLTRSFMFAGAPRVICSLWKVDDEATRALMVKFYALWNPKDGSKPLGTAAALKAAQDFVRAHEVEVPDEEATALAGQPVTKSVRPWAHPYYWAAWMLWGLS